MLFYHKLQVAFHKFERCLIIYDMFTIIYDILPRIADRYQIKKCNLFKCNHL